MKKRLYLLTALVGLAGTALTGCSLFGGVDGDYAINPEMSGGTKKQKTAILEAINTLTPTFDAKGNEFLPENTAVVDLPGDGNEGGSYIKCTTKQVVGDATVELEWDFNESQASCRTVSDGDEVHKLVELNYPKFGEANTSYTWTLKSAKCGSAKTKGDIATYKVNLIAREHPEHTMTIAEVNAITPGYQEIEGKKYYGTYDLVDYTKKNGNNQISPFYKGVEGDPNPSYHYAIISGKVVYRAPDGNWLLLADGSEFLEVYTGGGMDLLTSSFAALRGDYVTVHGNLSPYCGNVQLGFITCIEPHNGNGITEPVMTGINIDAAYFDSHLKLPEEQFPVETFGKKQAQCVPGLSNAIGIVEGKITKVSTTNRECGARFTYDVDIGEGRTIRVAYDYHCDREGTLGLFDKLSKKKKGDSIKVKGTMRYEGQTDKSKNSFLLEGFSVGLWAVVPCTAADVLA